MSYRRTAILAVLALMSACSANNPPEPVLVFAYFDPVGTYEMVITDDGEDVPAQMVIGGEPGAYTGTISAATRPSVDVSTVTATADQMTVTAVIPGGVLVIRLRVDEQTVTGDWSLRGDGGAATGTKSR